MPDQITRPAADDAEVVARFLRFVDSLPVNEPDAPRRPYPQDAHGGPGRRRWAVPLMAAAAAALVVFGLAWVPLLLRIAPPAAGTTAAVIPDVLPRYSVIRNADVESAPVGEASMIFQYGTQWEYMDWTRMNVLSADGRDVRFLGLANEPSRRNGDWTAPSALSPNGGVVAVGSGKPLDGGSPGAGLLSLVDLGTGDTMDVVVPGQRVVVPLTWTGNEQTLYLMAWPQSPGNTDTGWAAPGELLRLDVATRRVSPVPGRHRVLGAAVTPDGRFLALTPGPGKNLQVIDAASGAVVRTFADSATYLVGGNAWSPDGSWLAVTDSLSRESATISSMHFLSADGSRRHTRSTGLSLDGPRTEDEGLAWTSASTYAVHGELTTYRHPVGGPIEGHASIMELSLTDDTRRELSRGPHDIAEHPPTQFSMARNLALGMRTDSMPSPSRGPWPAIIAAPAAGTVALVVWTVARVRRRRQARAESKAAPEGG